MGPVGGDGLARESFNLKSCSLDAISAILARLGGRMAARSAILASLGGRLAATWAVLVSWVDSWVIRGIQVSIFWYPGRGII